MANQPAVKVDMADLDPTIIRSVLAALCPSTTIRSLQAGPTSYSNRLWLADTDEGALLVRVPGRDASPEYVRGSIVAARLAAQADVPSPRIRAFAPETDIGRPVLVQEFRPGERATTTIERDPGLVPKFAAAIGDWIGRLHTVQGPSFGSVLATEGDPDAATAAAVAVSVAVKALDPDALPAPAARIESAFDEAIGRCRTDQRASLVHGDIYFDNVLVHDGNAVGLLDFEHARFADRFADFGKLNELLFEWWPASREPFLEAYHEHFPPAADDEARTQLAIGLYELGQLAYFGRWQPDLVPVYRDRLSGWLSAR